MTRDALLAEIDSFTLYRILALRVDVFVVEQRCPYPELDRRDLEADARQLWVENGDSVLATLRLLVDPDGRARVGRVATLADARGRGLASALMKRALALEPDREMLLEAQSHLATWYTRFGFVVDGEQYVEDGIAHVPMRRTVSG